MSKELNQFLKEYDFTFCKIIFSGERSIIIEVKTKEDLHSVLKIRKGESKTLKKESEILQKLKHHNIVKYKGFYKTKEFSILEIEKVEGKCLIDLISDEGPLSEQEVKDIVKQLVLCLNYINENGLIHLDLKPDNLIYNPTNRKLTLIDFENLIEFTEKKYHISIGSSPYMSHEIIKKSFYGPEAQNWSLGVTIYALLNGELPEWNITKAYPFRIRTKELKFLEGIEISNNCKIILKKLLQRDSKKRATLIDIINSKWLNSQNENLKFFHS